MTTPFAQKEILLTGASRRTGLELAQALLKQGARLHGVYFQHPEQLLQLQQQYPRTCHVYQADVTDPAQVTRLLEQVAQASTHLDGLFNLVGPYFEAPILQTSLGDLQAILKGNLESVFLLCQAAYPLLCQTGQARVVNFGYSNGDRVVASRATAYHIAKLGVLCLSKSLAKEWAAQGITVNVIAPGSLENSIVKDSPLASDYIPAGRFGQVQDILNLLALLMQPESQYFTGNHLVLSGGYNL